MKPKEHNEFIVYWLPRMQDNAYNLISFQSEACTDAAEPVITAGAGLRDPRIYDLVPSGNSRRASSADPDCARAQRLYGG